MRCLFMIGFIRNEFIQVMHFGQEHHRRDEVPSVYGITWHTVSVCSSIGVAKCVHSIKMLSAKQEMV